MVTEIVGYVETPITTQDITTIILNAFDGGIEHWAKPIFFRRDTPFIIDDSQLIADILLRDKKTAITLKSTIDNDVTWELSIQDVLKGIALNSKERNWDASIQNGDMETFDYIIQYAIFGKILYKR